MSSHKSGERSFKKHKTLNYDKEVSDQSTSVILTSVMFFVLTGVIITLGAYEKFPYSAIAVLSIAMAAVAWVANVHSLYSCYQKRGSK